MHDNTPYFYEALLNDMNDFYKYLSEANFNLITHKRLLQLKANSLELNKFFNNKHSNLTKAQRYVRIMNNIKRNPDKYNIDINNYCADIYFLFMFSVDPNFEVIITQQSYNRMDEIKNNLRLNFGIYDINLIRLEAFYLRRFATEKKKKQIQDKVNEKVYK